MRDEDQMSPAAARLLRAARHADEPTQTDRARIGKSLWKAMMIGGVSAASSVATSAATAAAPSLLAKVAFIAATVGVLGTGGAWLSLRSTKEADKSSAPRVSVQTNLPASLPASAPLEAPERAMQRPEQLLAETRLLQAAQKAMRDGKHRRALGFLHRHKQQFPSGLLQPERDAAYVFALCEAGDAREAHEAAQKFAASHPTSPLLAKVKATCVR